MLPKIYQRRLHRDRYSSSGIPTDYLGYTSNPFDDLSATIEAIAANLPELNNETGLYSDTVSESESDFVDHEHDGTGHSANIQDSLDRLVCKRINRALRFLHPYLIDQCTFGSDAIDGLFGECETRRSARER